MYHAFVETGTQTFDLKFYCLCELKSMRIPKLG